MRPDEWGDNILSGVIPACEYVKLAVRRHVADLDKDWEYEFDPQSGMMPIDFMGTLTQFKSKWAGKMLVPSPWQSWLLYVFFGWKKKTGGRRFQDLYIEVPRKNGKTTFVAAMALYHFLLDGENAPEIYTVANNRDQAKECLNAARGIASSTPYLKDYLKVMEHDIKEVGGMGKMKSLAAKFDTLDGLNTSMGIFDEVHEYKDWELVKVITSSMGARDNPISAMITTAGFNKNYPCYENREMVIKILKGQLERNDLLGIIFTIDEGDDWKEPDTWRKANPNIGISPSFEHIEKEATKAIQQKSHELSFKTKHLNVWTDAEDVWITDDEWMSNAGDKVDLHGMECWGGLDIAETKDINAFVLLFKDNEQYHVLPTFWIPEKKVREREDRINYWKWKDEGYINVVPGAALSDSHMARDIIKLIAEYKPKLIAFDRFYSRGVLDRLDEGGINIEKTMLSFGTGYVSQSGPVRELERLLGLRVLNHFGNPVMRWMCSNVTLSMDASGNVKFDKSKSSDKIDGMAALAMAVGAKMNMPDEKKIDGNIRFL